MTSKEKITKESEEVYRKGIELFEKLQKREMGKQSSWGIEYHSWYTKAIKVVATLTPDRLAEFRSYYEIDKSRKVLGFGTWVLQDFLKNIVPGNALSIGFDSEKRAENCFGNQLGILASAHEMLGSALANIEAELYVELQDNEIATAKILAKVNLRAAGALVGVLIEGHLQKIANGQQIRITKSHPTIADLNESLKNGEVIDLRTWRKITYLADIRNICCHSKGVEPTAEQIEELITGADWVIKNVI